MIVLGALCFVFGINLEIARPEIYGEIKVASTVVRHPQFSRLSP